MLVGKALVAAQMAFCLLLLVVAALFTRSFRSLTQTDIGFDRAHVLTARVDVRGAGYRAVERQALYRRLVESLQAIPGVEPASLSANGPLGGSAADQQPERRGLHAGTEGAAAHQRRHRHRPSTSETVGLRIVEGRGFRAEDRVPGAHRPRSSMRRWRIAFFPGQSAVGKRWDYGETIGKDSQVIVGVVEDARYVDVKIAPPNMAYLLADTHARRCPQRYRGEDHRRAGRARRRPCATHWRAWSRGCRSSKSCRSTTVLRAA